MPYVKVALPWKLAHTEAQQTLTDGATIGPFRVVKTPGRTAGHVSVLWDDHASVTAGPSRPGRTSDSERPHHLGPRPLRQATAELLEAEAHPPL